MNELLALFSFRGRIGRARFWIATVIAYVIWYAGSLVSGPILFRQMIISAMGMGRSIIPPLHIVFSDWQLLKPWLIIFSPMILSTGILCAAGIKRLRDRGLWVWFIVPLVIIPTCLPLVFFFGDPPKYGLGLYLPQLAGVCVIWGIIELGILPGEKSHDTYDPGLPDRKHS